MRASDALLEVTSLSVRIGTASGERNVVPPLTFAIHAGETLGFVGHSGAGKTLSALAILGLLPRAASPSGSVRWRGRELLGLSDRELRSIRGREVALVAQDPLTALHPFYSITGQVAEAVRAHRPEVTRSESHVRAAQLLERVGIPRARLRNPEYPFQWSGGMRQRALIAMAIAHQPALLIADEPTTALDVATQLDIVTLLRELQTESGMAMLLITHDRDLMAAVTARTIDFSPTRATDPSSAVPKNDASAGAVILSVTDLAIHYQMKADTVRAVDGVTFQLRSNETVALVGQSGSGKSTLARALLGLEKAECGEILVKGQNVTRISSAALQRVRRSIQIVFQDPWSALNPRRSIGDSIAEPLHIHAAWRQGEKKRVTELLELVGLSADYYDRLPHQLSGGERQRVTIARAIALKPEILVLDEPFTAVDWYGRSGLLEVVARLQKETGMAILLIAHDLQLVRDVATRIIVMHAGEFIEAGETADLFERPVHPYTRALVAAALSHQTLGKSLQFQQRR